MSTLPLAAYGLEGAAVTQLDGGMINRSYRIDHERGSFVMKEYISAGSSPGHLEASWPIQFAVADAGLPVPSLILAADGSYSVVTDQGTFTLSEFVKGTLYPPGTMPDVAARRLGEMLGRMQRCLAKAQLPSCPVKQLEPPESVEAHILELLAIGNLRRGDSPLDDVVCINLEQKLRDLRSITLPKTTYWHWSHGDYEWRNVMFNGSLDIVAIFDFDEAGCFAEGREVLRCMELSFPPRTPDARVFLEGYATTSGITPELARNYVENWRYINATRTWPARVRYLHPERYQSRWDGIFLKPLPVRKAEEWEALADDFADIARQARA